MSNLPTWTEYVQFTHETANYPGAEWTAGKIPEYVTHGLPEEYGEIRGVFKRRLRDDGGKWTGPRLQQLRGEIGDMLWYCARYVVHTDEIDEYDAGILGWRVTRREACATSWWALFSRAVADEDVDAVLSYLQELASDFGWTLAEIAAENMAKLRDRKARGVIGGKGDNR